MTNDIHPDDLAVDRFAAAMKVKMAASRAKGRNGWDNPDLCPAERLQGMLIGHLAKGDPVDIGNFAMMLFNRNAPVATPDSSDTEILNWFDRNSRCEIGRDEDEDRPCIIYEVTGSRNDREWNEIGRGATLREAVRDAMRILA